MATTIGELNVKLNLELQRLDAQITQANGKIKRMGRSMQSDFAKATKSVSKDFARIGGDLVFGAMGANSAFKLLSREVQEVIRNIDNVPGVSPEAVESVNLMKSGFEEVEKSIQGTIAEGLNIFTQIGQGLGYGLGALVYGWDSAGVAYSEASRKAELAADSSKDLKVKLESEASAARAAAEAAQKYGTAWEGLMKSFRAEGNIGESTGAQISRLNADAAALEAKANAQFGGFGTERDRAAGGEGSKLYADASEMRRRAAELELQLNERAVRLGEAQRDFAFEQLDATEKLARVNAEIGQISKEVTSLNINDPEQFEAAIAAEERLLKLRGESVQISKEIDAEQQKKINELPKLTDDTNKRVVSATAYATQQMGMMWENVGDRAAQSFADLALAGEFSVKSLADVVARASIEMAARLAVINPVMNMFGANLPSLWGAATTPAVGASATAWANAYADGGRPKPGAPAIIGEEGPELWVPDSAGTIIPNNKLASMTTGSAGDTYIIDARGSDQAGLARLESLIRQVNGSIEKRAIGAVVDARNRGGSIGRALGA